MLSEEWFSTKTPKWDSQHFQSPLFSKYSTLIPLQREKKSHFYYHSLSCFIICFTGVPPLLCMLVGIGKKTKSIWKLSGIISFFWYQKLTKIDKNSQNFIKICPKTVLFRNIALIFSLEKPCYLENRVVREPCKRRTACTRIHTRLHFNQFSCWQLIQKKPRTKLHWHERQGLTLIIPACVTW